MKACSVAIVLTLAWFVSACTTAAPPAPSSEGWQPNIVDSIIRTRKSRKLVAALRAGDLDDVLKTEGPFTVLAPTDEAFAQLPAGAYDNLLEPENNQELVALLSHHIIPGELSSSELAASTDDITSLNGVTLLVSVDEGGVSIDGSRIVAADVSARNGTVHFVDTVLSPE